MPETFRERLAKANGTPREHAAVRSGCQLATRRKHLLRSLGRLGLAEQDPANEGGSGLAGATLLVRPSPVGDRGRLEQVDSHLCGRQLAPRGIARLSATRGSEDDGLGEAAGVEALAVLGGLPERSDRANVLW